MSERILILDDEASVLHVLETHLTDLGHECQSTTQPAKALDLLRAEKFSLLITDLRMPEMSGLEVVDHAKNIDPDIAIVIVTALVEVNTAIDAMREGVDDYLLKPFNLADIDKSTSRALEKRKFLLESRMYEEKLESRLDKATVDLERVNTELRTTKQYLEDLLDSTLDSIVSTNRQGNIEWANQGAAAMLGYDTPEFTQMPAKTILAGGEEEFREILAKLDEKRSIQNYRTELVRKDKSTVPVNITFSYSLDPSGEMGSVLAICKDITEQKRLEQELKELSIKDSLTGLYNQRYFFERLSQEIERAHRQRHALSLMLFDVDKFKEYNDSRGHLAGDQVLSTVGRIIRECTRDYVDVGCRYGGDEFTVILPEADESQAHRIADRMRRNFENNGFDDLTLSIGLATMENGMNIDEFIQEADKRMYVAKRSGGNRVCTECSMSDEDAAKPRPRLGERAPK